MSADKEAVDLLAELDAEFGKKPKPARKQHAIGAGTKDRTDGKQRLLSAKVGPAHVLHELGEILTASKYPTMTEDMARRSGAGPEIVSGSWRSRRSKVLSIPGRPSQ